MAVEVGLGWRWAWAWGLALGWVGLGRGGWRTVAVEIGFALALCDLFLAMMVKLTESTEPKIEPA